MGYLRKTITYKTPIYSCSNCGYEEESDIEFSWCNKCQGNPTDITIIKSRNEVWRFSISVGESIPSNDMEDFIRDIEDRQESDTAEALRNPNHKRFIKYIDKTKE